MSKLNLDLSEEMAEMTTAKLVGIILAAAVVALGIVVAAALAAGWIAEHVSL